MSFRFYVKWKYLGIIKLHFAMYISQTKMGVLVFYAYGNPYIRGIYYCILYKDTLIRFGIEDSVWVIHYLTLYVYRWRNYLWVGL